MSRFKLSVSIVDIFQSIFFTPIGKEFINKRSVAASRLLKDAEAQGNDFFMAPMSRLPKGPKLFAIATDKLSKESLITITSKDYRKARHSFKPFARMLYP